MKRLVILALVVALGVPAIASIIPGTYSLDGSWQEYFNGTPPRPGDIGNNNFSAGGYAWSADGTLSSVELVSSTGNTLVYESVYAATPGYNNVNLNYGGPWSPGNLVNYQALIEEITVITTKTYNGTPLQDESNLIGLSFLASGSGVITVSYPTGVMNPEMTPENVAISFTATSSQMPTFEFWDWGDLMLMGAAFDSAQITIVPEPATLVLLGLGGLLLRKRG